MVLTMTSNSLDSALLVYDKSTDQWCVGGLDDTVRISVLMQPTDDYAEHSAVGLAVSYNSTTAVPLSEYS